MKTSYLCLLFISWLLLLVASPAKASQDIDQPNAQIDSQIRALKVPVFIYVGRAGGIVCPAPTKNAGFSLLVFSSHSAIVDGEPSDQCQRLIQMLQQEEAVEEIGDLLQLAQTPNRKEIIDNLTRRIAATRLGITNKEWEAIIIDTRSLAGLNPEERRKKIAEIMVQQLAQLKHTPR